MNILVVGLSHKTAPVEIREKISFSEKVLPDALHKLRQYPLVREGAILSTCNRVEVYSVVRDIEEGIAQVKKFFTDFHDSVNPKDIQPHLYVYSAEEAVKHIFRVASSLDSMVVGEPQILGQLKDAFEYSLSSEATGVVLNRLFKKAISVGKLIRTETGIAESAVSVSYAAVELSKKIFEHLEDKTVMLVGAGEMSELAARHLKNNGVRNVVVSTRTYQRALKLAKEFSGKPIKFEDFPNEMVHTDIVICSTGAPHYLIRYDMVEHIIHQRKNKPVFFIDISVPRNIDPEINKIDNIYLYDIDDLQSVVDANKKEREKEAEKAEEIINSEVVTFSNWFKTLEVVPTIVALKEKMEEIKKAEIERTVSKLKNITEEEKKSIESMATAIVNKIIHTPLIALKQETNSEDGALFIEAVRKLFNLDKQLPHHEHKKKDRG
ncbi:MAG: glutamyl-tRNA reductase [Nitrospirae bacterium RBG_19FT_COMBO_42_15]|nr:MAG: glutamyl-tRNA reductase [Nitrospirae bacterium RBG_19FT_COMBO_42_15]